MYVGLPFLLLYDLKLSHYQASHCQSSLVSLNLV